MAESGNRFSSWTVEQLKDFLRDRQIPLSGNKAELVRKVSDIFETDCLENEIGAVPFQSIDFSPLQLTVIYLAHTRFSSNYRNCSEHVLEGKKWLHEELSHWCKALSMWSCF